MVKLYTFTKIKRMRSPRECVYCHSALKGRTDKKYCCERCKSRNNYFLKKNRNADVLNIIEGRLKNNRDILSTLYLRGNHRVSKKELISKGFDFEFYTTIRGENLYNLSFYCYDYGYALTGEGDVKIFRFKALSV